jgi:hypothetical protein
MGAFERIVGRLHRVFKREPETTPVAVITGPVDAILSIEKMTIRIASAAGVLSVSIETGTLAEVLAVINGTAGFTATSTNAEFDGLLARGLSEEPRRRLDADDRLFYRTGVLFAELGPVGWILDEQHERIADAEKALYLASAQGSWLDYWGRDRFGIAKKSGELDPTYATRLINEITRPTQNNVSLELIAKEGLGVDIEIIDAWPKRAELDPAIAATSAGRFILGISIPNELTTEEAEIFLSGIMAIVRKYKASGTDFLETVFSKVVSQTETQVVEETLAVTITGTFEDSPQPGAIFCGTGWVCGSPGLICGINNAIMEQCVVTVLNAADDSVFQKSVYGG